MATLSKLKPGQILYDAKRARGFGAVRGQTFDVWPVYVVSVHEDHAICHWNSPANPARPYFADALKRLRVKHPNQTED